MEEVRSEKLWTTFPIHLFSKQYAEKAYTNVSEKSFSEAFFAVGEFSRFSLFWQRRGLWFRRAAISVGLPKRESGHRRSG